MSRRILKTTAALGAAAGLAVVTGFTSRTTLSGTVYIGMDTPQTGAQQVVGQGDPQ